MNCRECQQLLQRRLDGEAVVDEAALHQHVTTCATCRGWQVAARRLREGLAAWTAPVPPADLVPRTVARVLAERSATARRRRRWRRAAVVAAGLLLVVFLGEDRRRPTEPPPLVRRPAADSLPTAPRLRQSVEEAGSAVLALTRRAADETMGQARVLFPPAVPPPLAGAEVLEQALEPPARSLLAAGQGVSLGLEPVARSARRAVDLFLREVPLVEPEPRRGF
jgi:hypothetical protein